MYTCITNNTMADTTISVRVDEHLRERMREFDTVNWSAVLRKAIQHYMQQRNEEDTAREEKMRRASESIDKMRASGVFNGGKTSVEIIREWRDKRK